MKDRHIALFKKLKWCAELVGGFTSHIDVPRSYWKIKIREFQGVKKENLLQGKEMPYHYH